MTDIPLFKSRLNIFLSAPVIDFICPGYEFLCFLTINIHTTPFFFDNKVS